MAWSFPSTLLLVLFSLASTHTSSAQSPSINTPIPPLQWLELTDLLSGPSPPALMDASIGYDDTSRTLLIFGGEANGIVQQQTYLLNLTSLEWLSPSPPSGIGQIPPPRSAAISGGDFAASNRHGHIVIGGKGSDGKGLQDAWEYDYNAQFWSQIEISPGGPSARWGASGGTDLLAQSVSDPIVPGPNNTFYLAGGFDGTNPLPLSDVWQFDVAGVLSPNLAVNNTFGSWKKLAFNTLPSKVRQAGAVMPSASIVAVGGCNVTDFDDSQCAQQDSYVLNTVTLRAIPPTGCPAPRVGAALVPNRNLLLTSFTSQAFMILGLFNDSLWDDGSGLTKGEVDVLNIQTGSWIRILPAGDPGSGSGSKTGSQKFPQPREGAAAFSFTSALVGPRTTSADTIIFGGRDANGSYLNDVWLLRAYPGSITSTNGTWAGFGNGILESGVDSSGAGVTIQYLTSCAIAISQPSPTGHHPSHSPSPTSSTSSTPPKLPSSPTSSAQSHLFVFDTSTLHKLFSPLSVALLLVAILFFRLSLPSATSPGATERRFPVFWLAALVALAAYAIGIAGIATSFSSIVSTTSGNLNARAPPSDLLLKTSHGKAGLAFFIVLYGLVPLLSSVLLCSEWQASSGHEIVVGGRQRKVSNDTSLMALAGEKQGSPTGTTRRPPTPSHSSLGRSTPLSPGVDTRQRTKSWAGGHLWPGYRGREKFTRQSSDSGIETASQEGTSRGFEVVNRNPRPRRASGNVSYGLDPHPNQPPLPRTLSDLSWLDRRRSVNAVGELDYVLSQLNRPIQPGPMSPCTDVPSTGPLMPTPPLLIAQPELPSPFQCTVHVFLHIFVLGICVLSLVALWFRAPKTAFIVFLIWTLAFYVALFFLAWHSRPQKSILSVLVDRLRGEPNHHTPVPIATPPSSRPLSVIDPCTFPNEPRGPYTYHQPPYRRALSSSHEEDYMSSSLHGFPHTEDPVDVEDEETQQRRIEQEMDRRDVSIVTVPKRKLWIANPS